MPQNENNWYKLDNAARLFPSVSTVTATNVFRLSARLYEEIIPEALQNAVIQALEETPSFQVRLRKGLFWYYFEQNTLKPQVKEEQDYPCRKFDRYTNNGYLFNVTYYGKYINVEFFHALCDGTGGSAFLSKIVSYYLIEVHKNQLSENIEPVHSGFSYSAQKEDSFVRVTRDKDVKGENLIREKAYNASTTLLQNGEIKVIKGIFSVEQLKNVAKSNNSTITEYLTAVLIYSLYIENYKFEPVNKPVSVCIPVNLRRFFPSETIRNFFTTIGVDVDFYKKDRSFEEILEIVKNEMKKELDQEKLYPKIMYCVNAQDNIFLRFVPLFIKNIALKYTFSKGEVGYTAVLSNLGSFCINDELSPFIERFEFLLSPTLKSRYKTSACSFKDKFVYSFTTNVENTEVQRRFFLTLAEKGIDVTVSCNIIEPEIDFDEFKNNKIINKQNKKTDKNKINEINKLNLK